MVGREEGLPVAEPVLDRRTSSIGYRRAVLQKLYRSTAARYRRSPESHRWLWRPFEWLVSGIGLLVARVRAIRFPEQQIGGWWWSGRWRFEFVLGWLEPESIDWVRRLVRPGMTVVDVGAHIGFYTLILSDLVGSTGKVLAFEPHPSNIELLRHNTRGRKNVEVLAYAVGAGNEPLQLHVSVGHSNHSLVEGYTEEKETIDVEGISLDSFLSDRRISAVDLLKIDVEGAEPQVLAGLTDALRANRIRGILTEFNPTALELGGVEPTQFLRDLRDSGFEVHALGSGGTFEDPLKTGEVVNLICLPIA